MVPKPGDEERTSIIPLGRTEPVEPPDRSEPPPAADDSPPASAAGTEHRCPHCGAEMVQHDAPPDSPKHNAWHCDACGGCWVHRGSAWFLRADHPPPDGWAGE